MRTGGAELFVSRRADAEQRQIWRIIAADRLLLRIARMLIHLHDGKLVVVHVLVKKTRKTPVADLNLARKVM